MKVRYIIILIALFTFTLFISCERNDLYQDARDAKEQSGDYGDDHQDPTIYALAQNGNDKLLLIAREDNIEEYLITNDINLNPQLITVADDNTVWVVLHQVGGNHYILRSDGTNYNTWLQQHLFEEGNDLTAMTFGSGRVYLIYSGFTASSGLWEFTNSGKNFIVPFNLGRALFYAKDENKLYITADSISPTIIYVLDFNQGSFNTYNANAYGGMDSFFTAKFESSFFIGYSDRMVSSNDGGTTPFPGEMFLSDTFYSIYSYDIGNKIYAAGTKFAPDETALFYFDDQGTFQFEIKKMIHASEAVDSMKIKFIGGPMLAIGIVDDTAINAEDIGGLYIYDTDTDYLQYVINYDIYDIWIK